MQLMSHSSWPTGFACAEAFSSPLSLRFFLSLGGFHVNYVKKKEHHPCQHWCACIWFTMFPWVEQGLHGMPFFPPSSFDKAPFPALLLSLRFIPFPPSLSPKLPPSGSWVSPELGGVGCLIVYIFICWENFYSTHLIKITWGELTRYNNTKATNLKTVQNWD